LSAEGKLVWKLDTGIVAGSLTLGTDRVFVTGTGRALAVSASGEALREASITNAVAPGLLSPSGLLFSAGADWVLAAYRFDSPFERPPGSGLPACPADETAVERLRSFDLAIAEGDRQLDILADIEKRLDLVTFGGSEAEDRAILGAIARGDFVPAFPASRRRFGFAVLPAAEACRLLGRIGAPDSIRVLAGIAASRTDPSVRTAAFYALGAMGIDPDSLVAKACAAAVAESHLDEQVARALIGAIEAQARNSGAEPSADAARALMKLAALPYGNGIRSRAMAAIGRIAGGE
jgi:hypothetical protein